MSDYNRINTTKLIEYLHRFKYFVQYMDGREGTISFRDTTGFLGREENYKTEVVEEARKELEYKKWDDSLIGSKEIRKYTKNAMSKARNLVFRNQQIDFKNRLSEEHQEYRKEAERVLFDIFGNRFCDDASAFNQAVKVFGAKYDTIAFLFYIKDDNKYLPISPGHFDKGFALLGIDYTTSHNCDWGNYLGFIDIIRNIRDLMQEILPVDGDIRLIDAHSFVWIIQQDRFINWIPNKEIRAQIELETEHCLQEEVHGVGGRRKTTLNTFIRSEEVVKETKRRAKGICQYCNMQAPFIDKKGNPYLEAHHVIWLSRGGEDSTSNTVALCPNCHTRMHVLDNAEDIEKLKKLLSHSNSSIST